jgi:ABC-type Na+ transport system ATPase subunit NatA
VVAARTITRFIRRCRDEGRTVLFSTHIMSEVEALCDRIAVIYKGRIAAVGTCAELREQTGAAAFEHVFLRADRRGRRVIAPALFFAGNVPLAGYSLQRISEEES